MMGHFVTACGCEQYKPVEYPPHGDYKLITRGRIPRDENRPFSTPRDVYGTRTFELVSVDITHALAEYREVCKW